MIGDEAPGDETARDESGEGEARGDLRWGSVPRLVAWAAARYGDREAVVDGDRRLTYAELGEQVRGAGRAVIAAGLEPGERAAVWAPNTAEWIVAALGIVAAGGVLVPLNTRFVASEARTVLAASDARMLFGIEGFLGRYHLTELAGGGGPGERVHTVVALRGGAPTGGWSWPAFLAAGEAVADDVLDARVDALTPDDLSDVIFTSGTTGRPKGAMLTHGQTLRVFADWCDLVGLQDADRYLILNPFFHTFGYKAGIVASLMRGAVMVPMATFDVDAAFRTIERERITVFPGPPAVFHSLLESPLRTSVDSSTLRLALTGAATVPVELVRRMHAELSFDTVLTGYGLTETNGTATICRLGDSPETVAHSCGRAIPGTEVRVVDPEGTEVPRGEPGEVVIRGYQVMRGYLGDPEATAATVDPGGWLHSGDIGVMDGDGYLRITDRLKDMFIVGGFNVYPAEVEQALMGHDDVSHAAVVGMPDERLGEVGAAYVVLRAGATTPPDELVAWCRAEVANFKVPRHLEIVDELPLSGAGKVDKLVLRARAAQVAAPGASPTTGG